MMIKKNDSGSGAGLYIHIPFCIKKCNYCDFTSFDCYDETDRKEYTDALIREIQLYKGSKTELNSVFFGGGTPSLLDGASVSAIMKAVRQSFHLHKTSEITLEANPKTVTEEKLKSYRSAGINRLSIGAQSFDDELLRFLGRAHTRQDFLQTYETARKTGFDNLNVDLIFGIPGQTMAQWMKTLWEAIMLKPEHLSFYSLQLEEGTPFYDRYGQGELELMPEEEDRKMYHEALGHLKSAGYEHYEISNCAAPGRACRHNLKYWSYGEYYGVGLGAHSFSYDKGRWCNVSHLEDYLARVKEGQRPVDRQEYQQRTPEDAMGEYVFTGLRKTEGINLEEFNRTFHQDFFKVYRNVMGKISDYQKQGYLVLEGEKLALTETGIDISDTIMAEFV